MRIILSLTLTILTLLSGRVLADSPSCFRFKLEINLVNSEKLIGDYFFYGMYLEFTDTTSFDEIISRIKYSNENSNHEQKLIIYKNVGILNYPKCWTLNLFYCLKEDIVELSLSQIQSYKVLEKTGCHPENKDEYKYAGGCRPEVVTELNSAEIKMLTAKPKFEFQTSYDYENYFGYFCVAFFLSYGNCDSTGIIKIINDFISSNNLIKSNETYMTDAQYERLKSTLRKKKIIMIRTYYYN